MAEFGVPGIEVKWHKDGEYVLPDSSNMLRFDLVVVNPRKLIGWHIRQEWHNLAWRERATSLLAWAIVALKGNKERLWT